MAEGRPATEEIKETLGEGEEDIFILSTDHSHSSNHLVGGEEGERLGGREIAEEGGQILAEGERRKTSRGVLTRVEPEEEDDYFEGEEGMEGRLRNPGGWRWQGEGGEGEERDEESDGLPSPSGLPGTTPPGGSRYMKHARRGHKYKGAKKTSLGHIPKLRYRDMKVVRRPKSMVTLQAARKDEEGGRGRRNTAPAISVGKIRRDFRQGSGGGGRKRSTATSGGGRGGSPVDGDDRSLQRKKKKRTQRRISHDRDKKTTQNPYSPPRLQPSPLPPSPDPPRRSRPPLIPVQSVDIPDYTPSLRLHDNSPTDPLTSSLNFLPPLRSSSAGLNGVLVEDSGNQFRLAPPLGRVYRSYSDAHVTMPTLHGRPWQPEGPAAVAVCPLDRKQFFKRFQKALKYAAGISRPQPHPPETPFHPHMSRYHSENLGLENPQARLLEELWVELQAHLQGRQKEEQREWLHYYSTQKVSKVLMQVVHFQIMPTADPTASLNTLFQAAPDYQPSSGGGGFHGNGSHREGYEEVGEGPTGEEEGKRDSPEKCSTDSSTVMGDDGEGRGGGGEEEDALSSVTASLRSQPWSVDSNDEAPQHNKILPQEFLSPAQNSAVAKVTDILEQLERVEGMFQNRRKIGDEHPQYRTLSFRRKIDALTLWLKVTKGLAQALATLSTWLGVSIIVPEMCREDGECSRSTSNESRTVSFALGEEEREEEEEGAGKLFSVSSPTVKDFPDPQQSLKRFTSRGQSSSGGSVQSRGTLHRMYSSYQSMSVEGGLRGPYRKFVDGGLKTKGLGKLMEGVQNFMSPVQELCAAALTPVATTGQGTEDTDDASQEELERRPLLGLRAYLAPLPSSSVQSFEPYRSHAHNPAYPTHEVTYERTMSVNSLDWGLEFESINLPHFGLQYIQLVHIPLDVMHECLKLQLGLHLPSKPSPLSVRQLVTECRNALEEAIKVRKKYREVMEVVTRSDHSKEQVDKDMEFFESDLNRVLMIYFNYLQKWVHLSSGHVLEEEWRHVKKICSHIRSGEAEAGRRFCDMAGHLLESTGDMFEARMDETCHHLHDLENSYEEQRSYTLESCRQFRTLFVEVREQASKAIGFAKMLRKDLEIAADFLVSVGPGELLEGLRASDHARVELPSNTGKMIFVPELMRDSTEDIHQLLSASFAHSDPSLDLKDSYILLVAMDMSGSEWAGHVIDLKVSAETTIAVSEMQIECVKMIVASSAHLAACRTSFLNALGKAVQLTKEQTSSHENVADRIKDLKSAACKLADKVIRAATQVEVQLCSEERGSEDTSFQTAMHACYNLGFEYIRDVFRLVGEDLAYRELGDQIMEYAQLWMRFVFEKCERGRGQRPRWASMGLDFLTLACAPRQLAHMSPTNFENLRKLMNRTLDHVVGEAPPTMGGFQNFSKPPTTPRRSPGNFKRKKSPVLLSYVSDPRHMRQRHNMVDVREEEEEGEGEGVRRRRWEKVEEEEGEEGDRHLESTPKAAQIVTFEADSHSNGGIGTDLEVGEVVSPPASTESVSSGHHSPPVPVSHDNPRPFISHTPPPPHPSPILIRLQSTLDREESNTSTASATSMYGSPFARSPSGGSGAGSESGGEGGGGGGGGGDRISVIRKKIQLLELNRDRELRGKRVIGRVKSTTPSSSHHHHPVRLNTLVQTHFKWQRGRKLGEGRFGKVYECRNLDTGEMMAVKQMSIQEKDTGTLQSICDEIGIFQKVKHKNIVQFHGLEIHHTELFLFMEYCHEGTLWSIAQQGLPEHMIRRYTRDLLGAVDDLHSKGIIHRDIKGANMFLSNDSIKLGDFGLSVQLKNLNKTLPNEIRQQVGTVPYLSPEVVLKQEMGRPLDIWSVGCVVVEMATGKLPWPEYDNQYQIMFQIGTGKSPSVAGGLLPDEGHDFLSRCFQSRPGDREKASELLLHSFVKISDET